MAAVDPAALIRSRITRRGASLAIDLGRRRIVRPIARVWVFGAGKAALAMATAVAAVAPEVRGLVVVPRATGPRIRRRAGGIGVLYGEHPVPGNGTFAATWRITDSIRRLPADATVLFLVSGGASSLFAAPAPGLTRTDKRALNAHLLRAGAPIETMNAVRKHLSAVKGGRLALLAAPREVVTLALSDVPGDALATIGSGPAVADPTTFALALRRLQQVTPDRSSLPARVWRILEQGAGGRGEDETPKPGDRRLARSRAALVGTNRTALAGAARAARELGYAVERRRFRLRGEAAVCAREMVAALPPAPARPVCLLAGGETYVRAGASPGKGGRSQEFALAAAVGLAGTGWVLLCAGTDGIDGQTDAAGAFCDGDTFGRGGRRRAARALAGHDSYTFFAALGDLHRTGPTGTNVMDVVIALHPGNGSRADIQ